MRKQLGHDNAKSWVLFNDEKVVKAEAVDAMKKFAYVYFFQRALPELANQEVKNSSRPLAAPNETIGTLFEKVIRPNLRGGAAGAAGADLSTRDGNGGGTMDVQRRIMSMSSVFTTVPVSYIVQTAGNTDDNHASDESAIVSLIEGMIQRSELRGELMTDLNGQSVLRFDKAPQVDEDEPMADQIQAAAGRVNRLMEDVRSMDRSMATENEYLKWVQKQNKGAAPSHGLEDASWPVGPDDEDLMAN